MIKTDEEYLEALNILEVLVAQESSGLVLTQYINNSVKQIQDYERTHYPYIVTNEKILRTDYSIGEN